MGEGDNIELLRDGVERRLEDGDHAWSAAPGQSACFIWPAPAKLEGVRLVFDSNLQNDKRMPCSYPQKGDACRMPASLVRAFRLEAQDGAGGWRVVHRENENCRRLVWVDLPVVTTALQLVIESSWGDEVVRVFAFEPLQHFAAKNLPSVQGENFEQARSRIAAENLVAPHSAEPAAQPRHSA
jgi:hypothetical protein